jgi:hypothetical protein
MRSAHVADDEAMTVGLDFTEPVQSYRVGKVQFDERTVGCKNRNVRFLPVPGISGFGLLSTR